jgi:hypothetical protein
MDGPQFHRLRVGEASGRLLQNLRAILYRTSDETGGVQGNELNRSGCLLALGLHGRKGAHQLQGALVAFKNALQFQALGTAALEGADAIGLGIVHGMTRTLGVPFCGFDFQHDQTILFDWSLFGIHVSISLL